MQKIATRLFMFASIVFGIIGIFLVFTGPDTGGPHPILNQVLLKILFVSVFVILPSFALSVAGKYLNNKSETLPQ